MQGLKIVALCIFAAVMYGVLHDQVTARICLEYFTIGHPRLAATDSPTVHGLLWGVIGTWWVGLLLGVPFAFVARVGPRHRVSARELIRPVGLLLLCMAATALVAGFVGSHLAASGQVRLIGRLAVEVPAERHVGFITALYAHAASYLAGLVGGLILMVLVLLRRLRPGVQGAPSSPPATI